MLHSLEKVGAETVGYCSVCSRVEELFELPGMKEKYCLECSADVAAAAVLVTEIDAGTLAGREVEKLVSERSEISSRLLGRAQSAELGF